MKRIAEQMTRLGEIFAKKSINKSDVARKTGLSKPRVSELTTNSQTKLRADELYLIALAIDVDPGELLEYVCQGLKLKI
jgi:DNA-binding Xre family transcriptional regulator